MNNKLSKNSIIVASKDQISADISSDLSGDVIILHLKNGVYYELNETCSSIWELIQKPCSFETVLDKIVAEYDVNAQQCETDLFSLVQKMIGQGLVEIKNE